MNSRVNSFRAIQVNSNEKGQLISVEAWNTHLRPRLQRWRELIHARGKKVSYHTDGSVRNFLPGLAECGVDILKPIQHICPGMELESLGKEWGETFVFHGGIDNQRVLPFGRKEDVRNETLHCLKTLGAHRGYIPCSCHNAQAGTPVENVLAMIETVRDFKGDSSIIK